MNQASPGVRSHRSNTWARERLWLGMSNVGFWVVTSITILFLPSSFGSGLAPWPGWLATLLGATLVQGGFDLVGGRWLPARHGRPLEPFAVWAGRWARGVLVQLGVLTLSGLTIAAFLAAGSIELAIATPIGAMLVLTVVQRSLAEIASGRTEAPDTPWIEDLGRAGLDPATVRIAHAPASSFVGGWTGLPGLGTQLVVPAAWRALPAPVRFAQLVRRRESERRGWRTLGWLAAVGFNGLGMALAIATVPSHDIGSLTSLWHVSAAFTLWSFVGLLTLPTLNRQAVFALDRAVIEAEPTIGPADLTQALTVLDPLQEDEPSRSPIIETIFHPIPSLRARIDQLDRASATRWATWHVARTALYLSPAGLGWLGRAVHCNAGFPSLWVLYPGD